MNLNHFEAIALVLKIAFAPPEEYFDVIDVSVGVSCAGQLGDLLLLRGQFGALVQPVPTHLLPGGLQARGARAFGERAGAHGGKRVECMPQLGAGLGAAPWVASVALAAAIADNRSQAAAARLGCSARTAASTNSGSAHCGMNNVSALLAFCAASAARS